MKTLTYTVPSQRYFKLCNSRDNYILLKDPIQGHVSEDLCDAYEIEDKISLRAFKTNKN